MSEIKALEKLREKIRLDVNNPWSDLKGDLLAMCDKTEAEIAERYMELPVDEDGVPIRVGDKMQYHGGEPFIVCAVAPCVIHTWVEVKLGERMTTCDYEPLQCTHYKPRTIEDVLEDFGIECDEQYPIRPRAELIAEYSAELRELLGVN